MVKLAFHTLIGYLEIIMVKMMDKQKRRWRHKYQNYSVE